MVVFEVVSDPVRLQYERFPYPPIPLLALPKPGEGKSLRFEEGSGRSDEGIRILVAGCGNFEPLVIAQANPRASEIVAVDLSEASLKRLRSRIAFAKVARFYQALPKINLVQADLRDWESPRESFDYVIASNVLQHVESPAELLERLATFLKPDGVLRIVTYPKQSRIFMRAVAAWFKVNDLKPDDPALLSKASWAIDDLPSLSPLRSTFLSHPERARPAGLVDAFFHACENPLSPLEWKTAATKAGLVCSGESQTETSRSTFVEELLPETRDFDAWDKLQVLDDTLELCANPVLWFKKASVGAETSPPQLGPSDSPGDLSSNLDLVAGASPVSIARTRRGTHLRMPSRIRWEIAEGLRSAGSILETRGIGLKRWLDVLGKEVGPRVTPAPDSKPLPGLSILEYPAEELLSLPQPLGAEERSALQRLLGPGARLRVSGESDSSNAQPPEGLGFVDQWEWVELRHGPERSWIDVQIF